MNYELTQSFYFEAAHTLKTKVEPEASRRIHGHTYVAEITLSGRPDPDTGMLIDLGLFRQTLADVRAQLDHRLLDEVPGLGVPTLENLCHYLWQTLIPGLPQLTRVTVRREASGDRCTLTR